MLRAMRRSECRPPAVRRLPPTTSTCRYKSSSSARKERRGNRSRLGTAHELADIATRIRPVKTGIAYARDNLIRSFSDVEALKERLRQKWPTTAEAADPGTRLRGEYQRREEPLASSRQERSESNHVRQRCSVYCDRFTFQVFAVKYLRKNPP